MIPTAIARLRSSTAARGLLLLSLTGCLLLGLFAGRPPVVRAAEPVAESESPCRWAVLIACEKYLHANRLQYTVNDVRRIGATLKTHGGYDPENILEMTDQSINPREQPLKANLTIELPAWLKKAGPADTLIVYFSGHGFRDAGGKMYLAPLDVDPENPAATGIPIEWFRDQIAGCKAKFKLLLIDACHAGSEKGEDEKNAKRQAASKDLGDAFKDLEGVVTIASSTADQKSQIWEDKQQSLFSYWLDQGLKGHADADNDGNVDIDELYKYVSRQVTHSAKLHFSRPQTPVRIVRPGTVGVPVVIHLRPQPLARVLSDMAEQLADALADRQLPKVGVLEFTNITPAGSEVLGGNFGLVGRYCAEELGNQLTAKGTGQFSVIDNRRLQEALRTQQFRLGDLASSRQLKGLSDGAGGMPALVQGILRNRSGRVVNLQCKLVETEGDDVLGSVGGTAVINESEWAMLGHSAVLKPEDYRSPEPAQPGQRPRTQTDQVVERLDQRAQEGHPLNNPAFPFPVQILVGGEERKGTFRGNDLFIPLSKGEVFEIKVSNHSGRLVLMRLLVDGLSTLPEPAGGKGVSTMAVGKRVNLDQARHYVLDPNGPEIRKQGGDATWAFRGFATETGAEGKLREFKVVDAQQSLAARQQFTDQLGLITVAFYEPAAAPRGIGIGLGQQRDEDLTERDAPPVGRPVAVVNIHYVEAAVLAGNGQ